MRIHTGHCLPPGGGWGASCVAPCSLSTNATVPLFHQPPTAVVATAAAAAAGRCCCLPIPPGQALLRLRKSPAEQPASPQSCLLWPTIESERKSIETRRRRRARPGRERGEAAAAAQPSPRRAQKKMQGSSSSGQALRAALCPREQK